MTLTVDLEKSLIICPNDVDTESISFGALGVVGATATLVITRNSNSHHIPAHSAKVCILLVAIDQMKSLYTFSYQIVSTLRSKHITRHMHKLPDALGRPLSCHSQL